MKIEKNLETTDKYFENGQEKINGWQEPSKTGRGIKTNALVKNFMEKTAKKVSNLYTRLLLV